MGLISGSLSMTRYKVLGLKKSVTMAELNDCLLPMQSKSLRLSGVLREQSFGWVRPTSTEPLPLSETDHWDLSECRAGDGFVLRIRVERRAVPSRLLQLVLKERILKKEAKRAKPLSRNERRQIMEDTKKELVERALPNLSYIDVYWRERHGSVYVLTQSKRALAIFEELFRKTFGEPLDLSTFQMTPPLNTIPSNLWRASGAEDPYLKRLALTIPTGFAEHTT